MDYDLFDLSEARRCVEYLDAIGAMLAAGEIKARVQQTFAYGDAQAALAVEAAGHVMSKLSVVPPSSYPQQSLFKEIPAL